VTDPLRIPPEALAQGTQIRLTVLPDAAALTSAFADALLAEYLAAKEAGRARPVFIVPVGPVGQYDVLAELCRAQGRSLADLTLIGMDEYLTPEGAWIAEDDPLSFRGHLRRHLTARMPDGTAPRVVFPDPRDLDAVPRLIAEHGGVDVAFGGVGIAGHLAFNEPPEPGEDSDAARFAQRPTRIQRLSRETRTINAVTATRGAIDLIPDYAVTIGMAEILAARKLRLFMNRPWQTAILRKLLHGPVTSAVPASYAQRHPDCAMTVTEEVTRMPGATLA
jgi:glucosamine-6-phosphate deaminase